MLINKIDLQEVKKFIKHIKVQKSTLQDVHEADIIISHIIYLNSIGTFK